MKSLFNLRNALVLFSLVAVLAILPSGGRAQGDEDVYRENTDIQKIFHKLGRGVSNVLLGWVEIPKNIAKEWRKTEPFTGTIVGLFKGVGWGVARTFAGFYEIISFPFPVPRNYQAIMYPEFVLPSVWGERLPLYQDEFLASKAGESQAVSDLGGSTGGNSSPRTFDSRTY